MHGARVFYDEFEQTALWGQNLVEGLDRIYRKDSVFVVMFISLAYRDKEWTRHERRSALSAALTSSSEYVLPVRFDSTELDGLHPTTGYLNLKNITPSALGELIVVKLRQRGVDLPEGVTRLVDGGYTGWRVLSKRYNPLSAEAAAKLTGRWHEEGQRGLYVAPSLCNAILEVLVHVPTTPRDYVAVRILMPEGVSVQSLYSTSLQQGWQNQEAMTRTIGSSWYKSRASCILSVPSAILPEDRFLLLNTEHPDFSRVEVMRSEPLQLDLRLRQA